MSWLFPRQKDIHDFIYQVRFNYFSLLDPRAYAALHGRFEFPVRSLVYRPSSRNREHMDCRVRYRSKCFSDLSGSCAVSAFGKIQKHYPLHEYETPRCHSCDSVWSGSRGNLVLDLPRGICRGFTRFPIFHSDILRMDSLASILHRESCYACDAQVRRGCGRKGLRQEDDADSRNDGSLSTDRAVDFRCLGDFELGEPELHEC